MAKYIFKRIIQTIITIIVVSVLIFFAVRIAPTDPIASITKGKSMSIETKQAIEHEYHLDESLPRQYYSWISGIFHGDLGKSFQYRESVTSLLAPRLSTTVQLVIMAAILIIIFSIPLGIISASHKNSWLD